MVVWSGGFSRDFLVAENWVGGVVPAAVDVVTVPDDVTFDPRLFLNATIAGLTLDAGAGLWVAASGDLTVTGATTLNGRLLVAQGGALTLAGLVIGDAGSLSNAGVLTISNADPVLTGPVSAGMLNNSGFMTLEGTVAAMVRNPGTLVVEGPSSMAGLTNIGTLRLKGATEVLNETNLSGALTFYLNADSSQTGSLLTNGPLTAQLTSVQVLIESLPLDFGAEGEVLMRSTDGMFDSLAIDSFDVIGRSFAYLALVSADNLAEQTLTFRAMPSRGQTPGVLFRTLEPAALTITMNTDTGRGTLLGGSYSQTHTSFFGHAREVYGSNYADAITFEGLLPSRHKDLLVKGRGGHDTIKGGAAEETFYGDGGQDLLVGGGDQDHLYGGIGRDTLFGGGQRDFLYGGEQDDLLDGGIGDDFLYGGTLDADTMRGGEGDDLYYFVGPNTLVIEDDNHGTDSARVSGVANYAAPSGVEHVILNAVEFADVTLRGNSLANQLAATAGNSVALLGLAGNDTLTGNASTDDTLNGGGGNDRLIAHGGTDVLIGALGADHFAWTLPYAPGSETHVRVADFTLSGPNRDTMAFALNGLSLTETAGKALVTQIGSAVLIESLSQSLTVTLQGISVQDLREYGYLL